MYLIDIVIPRNNNLRSSEASRGTRADVVTDVHIYCSMDLPAYSGPRPFVQFRDYFSHKVGLLGRVISPSQGRYLNTGQQKHRINESAHAHTHTHTHTHTPNTHALSGIRTHDPSVRASEEGSCTAVTGVSM
jgi:hypothetical protein